MAGLGDTGALIIVASDANDMRVEFEALTGLARLALRDGRYDDVIGLARQGREVAPDALASGSLASALA